MWLCSRMSRNNCATTNIETNAKTCDGEDGPTTSLNINVPIVAKNALVSDFVNRSTSENVRTPIKKQQKIGNNRLITVQLEAFDILSVNPTQASENQW